ncbi:natural killer cell receptor 2B4-like [Sinocyclocheilus rhinocerous]|uniref:natural killer cell receptor 2B4-like n=1 Tax=Sinocyclocheilus rhinocerous TaxID=307959 RepID=UPI0007BA98C2|nr:PREDICTED: natural killer cell receptor 2B4-like [Sinocyclocheilus rhinocerous]
MVFHAFFCLCLWLLGGVSDVYTDETVMISVMEGDSVILNTNVTELQKDDHILWSFRLHNSETRIAEIYKQIISIYASGENERFRDRLKIDEQTGSLTITNINKLHSGLYKLQIISGVIKHMSFSTAVYGILPVPVIIRDSSHNFSSSSGSSVSRCSLLCSVLNVSHVTLSWYKGNSLLSSISVSDLSISLSLPLEVEYQDKNTYSCVLNNPISNQTKHLDITQLCQPNSESNQTSLVLVVLLLLLLLLVVPAVVVLICRRRNYTQAKQEAQSNEEEVDYTDATFIKHGDQDTGANGHDRTVYSEVVLRR